MAHNITNTDSLILARRPAWHGLGTVLPDTFTPDEALAAGYLDWQVSLVPVWTAPLIGGPNDGAAVPVDGHRAVVRSDTGTVLGIVGDRYTVVQNSEVFALVRDGVAAVTDAPVRIESCGSFKGGAITFVCVETHQFQVSDRDTVRTFALFGNSHDGSRAFTALNTSVRVVCNNTYNMALREGTNRHAARHTATIHGRIERIASQLVAGVDAARAFEAQARRAASIRVRPGELQGLYERAYAAAIGVPEDDRQRRKASATIADWRWNLQQSGLANLGDSSDGSLWAVFNSVTQWADHARTVRSETPERRMHANLYGDAAEMKQAVWEALVPA
jgi:phage/plasmid-like protein (TIGR03299 family)